MAKKVLNTLSFSALINYIKNTQKTSSDNSLDVSNLEKNLQELTSNMLDAVTQINEALQEFDDVKQDKSLKTNFIIPTTSWKSDSTNFYPNYYDIVSSEITSNDEVTICIAPTSIKNAINCGLCPTTETLTNKIRIRATQIPTTPITVEYYIKKG